MKEIKYYPEIRVQLIINEGDVLSRNEDASPNFSEGFLTRMNDKIYSFKSRIDEHIYQLNTEGIFILFEEFGLGERDLYKILIQAKDEKTALKIIQVIKYFITDIDLEFRYVVQEYETQTSMAMNVAYC